MTTYAAMADGLVKGYFVMGENPVVGSMNGGFQREAMRQSGMAGRPRFSPPPRPPSSGTLRIEPADRPQTHEVFFFPAAAHTEKDGSFTNTQRLLQWHHKAIEPPGDCRSELHFIFHLGGACRRCTAIPRIRKTGRSST